MRKIEFRSIKTKLIVSIIAVVMISCLLLAIICTFNARNSVENELHGTIDGIGLNSVSKASLIFQAGEDSAILLATRPTTIDLLLTEMKSGPDSQKRQENLKQLEQTASQTSNIFNLVRIVNLDGVVIVSNEPEYIGEDYKENALFKEGLKGNYIADPYRNTKKEPRLGFSTPIRDSSDKVIGVLVATGPLSYFEEKVLDIQGMGSTAKAMIVDMTRDGLFLTKVKGDDQAFLVKKAKIDNIQEGKLNYWTNVYGEEVVGSRYPIKEKEGWYLVIMETQEEALAAINAMILEIVIVTLLVIAGGVVFAYYLARSIATPIITLSQASDNIALGDVSQEIEYRSPDELGQLADSFRKMIAYFQEKADVSNALSIGDLNVHVPVASEKDILGLAMTQMKDVIAGLVSDIVRIASAAGSGKLDERGDPAQFNGEYRKIILGLNNTLDSVVIPVTEAMRLAGSYAAGDYVDRMDENISIKGDFIPFKEALNRIGIQGSSAIGGVITEVENLTAGMEETNASAEEVSSSTSTLAESSATVSTLAERSENGIKQTLMAMEDLSLAVSAVAAKAESASSLARDTAELSEKGVSLAGRAEKGMEGIMHSVEETGSIIDDITSQMEEIGNIVDVITGIAEQTGLLALNAAIEAARAGEAGMGFAVVADEVKSLALESQKSAENISSIIGNLQKKSHLVSESMKSSSTEVKAGNESLTETLTVFHNIVKSINQVNNHMGEVAGATEEQAASVEEITASVHEVENLVQETAREAVSSAAATEEVNAAIDQVTRAISDASLSIQKIADEMGKFRVV